jgi:hypothetical protein
VDGDDGVESRGNDVVNGRGRTTYLFSDVSDCSQDSQYIQEAIVVIVLLYRPAVVAFGQLCDDFGGDEVGGEEGC